MIDPNPEQLPAIKTPLTTEQAYVALDAAWLRYFGSYAPHTSLLVLLAQSALETGRWRSLWNYNFGNAKSSPGDGRCWTHYRCNELLNGQWIWFDPPHPQTRFRAYRCVEDGASDYLALLVRRFAGAWPAVMAGDPGAFCEQLHRAGYYTAPLEGYLASVVSIYHEFARTVPEPERHPLTEAERERVMNLVGETMREGIDEQLGSGSSEPSPTT